MSERVIIVGAGQAGLAIGYFLEAADVEYLILDGSGQIGSSWAKRWDSLRLFTPAQYSSLPSSPFPSFDPRSFPTKDEVSQYIENYARTHRLNVRLNSLVTKVEHDGKSFMVSVAGKIERANQVVIATGPFSTPWIPPFALALEARIQQIHSEFYQNPSQVHGEDVVVVGGGNSGLQIALELARAGKHVYLSERTRARTLPHQVLGRSVFWWLDKSRIVAARANSPIGRHLRKAEPIIGTSRRQLRKAGVVLHPGTLDAAADTISFSDGAVVRPDAVIWATGYSIDDRWIDIPAAVDGLGNLVIASGVTPMPGLFTIGRHWQRSRGSSLLGFVEDDARELGAAIRQGTDWLRCPQWP